MSGRHGDAIWFGALALAAAFAWWATRIEPDETGFALAVPDFSLPGIELEVPIELPRARFRLHRPDVPRLELGRRDTEGVIAEVRRALLDSARRNASELEDVPRETPAQLASAVD